MIILAIDPGPERSAWLTLHDTGRVLEFAIEPNGKLLERLWSVPPGITVVIEQVASFGMAVGAEVFETVFWSGRFAEASAPAFDRITRLRVKQALCHDSRAKDANIRAVLIDRFGPGKDVAVGTKSKPGPLFGVTKDVWSALAVAVTYAEQLRAAA